MSILFDDERYFDAAVPSAEPLRIYTGILGQIGDIVMFTATVRRVRELFPNSEITFAVSKRYREAGELVVGLPYVDRLFVAELYFEKLSKQAFVPWHRGWPMDLRGDDEVAEQRRHDMVLETRPRHRRMPWWKSAHQVAEMAHMLRIPGPIDLRTEVAIPPCAKTPVGAEEKIVLHNDPSIDAAKAWPWTSVNWLVRSLGAQNFVLLGNPGPEIPGVLDLRGRTTLAEAACVIRASRCFVGIDSGLMWIAGSLQAPTVGLYGTSYIAAYGAIQPKNTRAVYLQAEGPLSQLSPQTVLEKVERVLEKGRESQR